MKKNRTLMTLVGCMLLVFAMFGTGFTTRANAQENESLAPAGEQAVQPRFGGKSYASAKFVNAANQCNGYSLYVKAYAENYIWPFTDVGHAWCFVNFTLEDEQVAVPSYEDTTVHMQIQFCWDTKQSTIYLTQTVTVIPQSHILSSMSGGVADYPYGHELVGSVKNYNNTGRSNSGVEHIKVTLTASYPGGFSASVTTYAYF